MAVGIAAGVRVPQMGGLGNVNPLEMMKSMFELRNMQQQFQSNTEAGQILATSKDWDEASQRMMHSPNSAWMLQQLGEARNQRVAAADIERTLAEAQRTRFNTGIDAVGFASKMAPPDSPDGFTRLMDATRSSLDPRTQREVGGLFDTIKHSVLDGLDPNNPVGDYNKRLVGIGIGSGLTSTESYGRIGGLAPQVHLVPDPAGGPSQLQMVGGYPTGGLIPGSGPGGTGGTPGTVPLSPTPMTKTQIEQFGTLQERQKALATDIQSGNTVMQNVNKVEELLKNFKTSSLTERRASWAGLAQALGADEKQVKEIAGGDLSSEQEAIKYLYGTLIQRMDTAMPPGGRLNLPTTNAFLAAHPQIGMQDTAIRDIFDGWRRAHIANIIQQRILGRYMTENARNPGAASAYPDFWQGIQQRKGLADPHYYIPGTTKAIPPSVIMELLANPTAENKRAIDSKYGPGTSARFTEDR